MVSKSALVLDKEIKALIGGLCVLLDLPKDAIQALNRLLHTSGYCAVTELITHLFQPDALRLQDAHIVLEVDQGFLELLVEGVLAPPELFPLVINR